MNQVIKIEIPVEAETARALADQRRREAVGRLIDRMVRPTAAFDPLAKVPGGDGARSKRGGSHRR